MAICALLQHHLLVPVHHYQDDHHCVEPSCSVAQAWTLIRRFYGLLGPKLATPGGDKYPLPSQVYRLLGTKVDLIVSPREIQVLPSRIDSICCELNQILSSKKLGKGHAAEIFGKLSFSAGQLFGRFGRMHLAPFKLRQYGKNGCSHLTAEIERAIAFWLYVLPRGPFRAVPPHSGTPFVITMSDGEGTGSVAVAIWSPLAPGGVHQPRWFQLNLPPSALHSWSEGKELEPQRHINKIEAIVPAICLCTVVPPHSRFPFATLHLQRWCFVLPCLRMLKKQLVLGCWPWFERVPSKCNIVDGLSRKNFLHCARERLGARLGAIA